MACLHGSACFVTIAVFRCASFASCVFVCHCVYRVLMGAFGWCLCCVLVSMYRKYSVGPVNSWWLNAGNRRVGVSVGAGLINRIGGKPLDMTRCSNARDSTCSCHMTSWYVTSHPVQQHTSQNRQLNLVNWSYARVMCLLIMCILSCLFIYKTTFILSHLYSRVEYHQVARDWWWITVLTMRYEPAGTWWSPVSFSSVWSV